MLNTSTIRPGLLVSLKTSLSGNVSYQVNVIEPAHIESDGTLRQVHETAKTIIDPAEHEAAIKIRGKASSLIRGQCAKSEFGLLCPQGREEQLDRAIDQAYQLVRDFNRSTNVTRISVNVVVGRFEQDDARAIKSINREISDLLETIEQGIGKLDAEAVRKAASKAKDVGRMLNPVASEKLTAAIKLARKTATRIIEAGDNAAAEIDASVLRSLAGARTAFLDLDDAVEAPVAPAAAPAVQLDIEDAPYANLDDSQDRVVVAPAPQPAAPDVEENDDSFEVPDFLKKGWNNSKPKVELETE
jgi:hypothetical protein